jgi:hypothetical protein
MLSGRASGFCQALDTGARSGRRRRRLSRSNQPTAVAPSGMNEGLLRGGTRAFFRDLELSRGAAAAAYRLVRLCSRTAFTNSTVPQPTLALHGDIAEIALDVSILAGRSSTRALQ